MKNIKGFKKAIMDPLGKEIVCAPTKKISKYKKQVQTILKIIGHPEAFVTDRSRVGDFDPHKSVIKNLQKIYPDTTEETFIVDIAEHKSENK
jgi:hypothetical protein